MAWGTFDLCCICRFLVAVCKLLVAASGIYFPSQGLPHALGAQSLNHWTAREVPT